MGRAAPSSLQAFASPTPKTAERQQEELRFLLELAVGAGGRRVFRNLAIERLGQLVSFDRARFGVIRSPGPSLKAADDADTPPRVGLARCGLTACICFPGMSGPGTSLELDRTRPGAMAFESHDLALLDYLHPALALAEFAYRSTENTPESIDVVPGEQFSSLSTRERQVLLLLCRGLDNAGIAALLGSSVNTVRNQLASIYRKCGTSSRTQVVRRAIEVGLARLSVPPPAPRQGTPTPLLERTESDGWDERGIGNPGNSSGSS